MPSSKHNPAFGTKRHREPCGFFLTQFAHVTGRKIGTKVLKERLEPSACPTAHSPALSTFLLDISPLSKMTSNKTLCLDKESILAAVLQLGVGGPALSLDGEFRGGQCHVCKLSFIRDPVSQDRESLAVRVPLYMSGNDEIISALETEWQTLQILRAKGFAWSPRPLGCCLTFDNPVKHPFLVLTWGEGSTPRWDDISPPRPLRDKFLTQLAAIQMCLIRCTLENGMLSITSFGIYSTQPADRPCVRVYDLAGLF